MSVITNKIIEIIGEETISKEDLLHIYIIPKYKNLSLPKLLQKINILPI